MHGFEWLDEIERRGARVTAERVRAVEPSTAPVSEPRLLDSAGEFIASFENTMQGWRNALLVEALWNERKRLCVVVRELVDAVECLIRELDPQVDQETWMSDGDALPRARAALAKVRGEVQA